MLPGWKCDITAARKCEDLPKAAQDYVLLCEKRVGCPITYVSVGAESRRAGHSMRRTQYGARTTTSPLFWDMYMDNAYETPLNCRYAQPLRCCICSRPTANSPRGASLWVALAESEMELGLPITQAQVDRAEGARKRTSITRPRAATRSAFATT